MTECGGRGLIWKCVLINGVKRLLFQDQLSCMADCHSCREIWIMLNNEMENGGVDFNIPLEEGKLYTYKLIIKEYQGKLIIDRVEFVELTKSSGVMTKEEYEARFSCDFCDKSANDTDNFMVTTNIWKEAGFKNASGIICFDCIEKKLDRKLKITDFNKCSGNSQIFKGYEIGKTDGETNFICWLINHCENEIVTEEFLQNAYTKYLEVINDKNA